MRICFVCNEYPPRAHGGIGTYVKDMAEGLVRAGEAVTVVGLGERYAESEQHGVHLVELSSAVMPGFLSGYLQRLRLYRYLKGKARAGLIDIVEVPDYHGWLPFKFDYCPVVVRLHLSNYIISQYAGERCSRQISYYERQTLDRHGAWVGVSQFALSETKKVFGINPKKSDVIYDPVTSPTGVGCESVITTGRYVLYAGSISERKGAYTLARASERILGKYPDLSLVYAGPIDKPGTENELRSIIGMELSGRVIFTGRLPRVDVMSLMRQANVFVFPSKLETFGLVIAEAMLNGTPTVCCNTGPCPEFVTHGQTGELVGVDDDVAIVESVSRILDDPAYATRLSQAGREYIGREFSLEKVVVRNMKFYRSLLGVTK